MADESESLFIPGSLIVGGLGLFAGSYFVKDPKLGGVMKVGGVLATITGVVLGGEALLKGLGLGDLFKKKGPETVRTDELSTHEKALASGALAGEFISPTDGGDVSLPTFGQSYMVKVRIINGTANKQRAHIELRGTESHWSSEDNVGGSLEEVDIDAGKSILRQVEVNSTTVINAFPQPVISMGLFINDVEVDRISYTTS